MRTISAAQRATAVVLGTADALSLLLAGLAAAWVRFPGSPFRRELSEILAHPGFVVYAVVTLWALCTTFDLYRPENWRSRDQLLVRLAAMAVAFPVALVLGTYVVLQWRFGRGLLALTLLFTLPAIGLIRLLWLATVRPQSRRALVIGDGPIVEALRQELARRPAPPFTIADHVSRPSEQTLDGSASQKLAETDLVILANINQRRALDRLAELNFFGTAVIDAAGAYATLTGRIPVLQVDSRWFLATGDFSSLATSPFHHVQRILDLVIAATLFLLSLPILLAAMAALWIVSGRPILYRQQRLGQYRRPFTLLKLRTMANNSESDGPVFAAARDERVHALGRFYRRWRIDELPQLINVLRGDMSLVGPRPERPEVARRFEKRIPFFAFRYSVKPGISGWAQVNLPYCSETEEHIAKLEFDLYSLRHHGPGMYIMVLLRTFGALVLRPGR